MLRNEYTLNVDLKRRLTSIVPTFRYGDAGTLRFRVYDDGKLVDLSQVTETSITFERPDGTAYQADASIEGELVVYNITGVELSARSNVKINTFLTLTVGDTKTSIQPFSVFTYDTKNPEEITYIGVLQELISQNQNFKLELSPIIDNFKTLRYTPGVTYRPFNFVTYEGSTYAVLREVSNITPVDDGVNYLLAAAKGEEVITYGETIPSNLENINAFFLIEGSSPIIPR